MTINETEGQVTCVLEGHYDTLKSQRLEEAVKAIQGGPNLVTFDMQAVTYVCSAFLRVCLLAARMAGVGKFRIAGVTPPIKRVFMMAGLASLLAGETHSEPGPQTHPKAAQ